MAIDLSKISVYGNKGRSRLRRACFGLYNQRYYPSNIRDLIREQLSNDRLEKTDVLPTNKASIQSESLNLAIYLAGSSLSRLDYLSVLLNESPYQFSDAESLHAVFRFHWCLDWISKGVSCEEISFIVSTILKWIAKTSPLINEPAWQPYNVSERIVNLTIILSCLSDHISHEAQLLISDSLRLNVRWLCRHLEYPASKIINNHILNNARALYFSGCFFDSNNLKMLSRAIFQTHSSGMIDKNGCLQEASTHYQLLLSKNIYECYLLAKYFDSADDVHLFEPLCSKMLSISGQFCEGKSGSRFSFPTIGDVSPDTYAAWFLIDFTLRFGINISCGWYKIWSDSLKANGIIAEKNALENSFVLPNWIVVRRNNWAVFSHQHQDRPNYPDGHGHYDYGGFCLYDKENSVLIDAGRPSYSSQVGVEAASHNLVTLSDGSYFAPRQGEVGFSESEADKQTILIWPKCFSNKYHEAVVWQRKVIISDSLKVSDSISNHLNQEQLAYGWFNFDANMKIEKVDPHHFIISINDKKYSYQFSSNVIVKTKRTFIYPEYGYALKSESLYWSAAVNNILEVTTRIERI